MAVTIPVTGLTQPDPLKTITPTPDPILSTGQGVIDSAVTNVASAQAELDKAQKAQQDNLAKLAADQEIQKGKAADIATANESAGVNTEKANLDKYNQQLNDINANISGLANEAKAIPLKVQEANKNTGATDIGVAPQTTGQLRENAIKALTQSSLADIAIANVNNSTIRYNAAKDKAQQAIDLKYQPIEQEIANLKEQLSLNKQYITDPAEKKLADAQTIALNERARVIADSKENEKNISSILLEIQKNGTGTPELLKAVGNAKSVGEAIQIAGDALKTPNTEIIKMKQGDNEVAYVYDKTTNKIVRTLGVGTPSPTGVTPQGTNGAAYAGVVNTILGSGKFTKDQAIAVKNAINNGEDPFVVVKNNAKNIMGQTEATALGKNEDAKSAMEELQSSLSDFYAKGGKSSIFKGNFEKVSNNLGNVNDPKLVDLAVQIAASLQKYRNAISGTAYSEQEGKDIASIFPSISNGQILNDTIVKARLKTMTSDIDNAYRKTVGSAYDKMKAIETSKNNSKGTLSDRDFVSKAFEGTGLMYDQVVNKTPQGQIPVADNATGKIGYIPYNEYNASQYTKL